MRELLLVSGRRDRGSGMAAKKAAKSSKSSKSSRRPKDLKVEKSKLKSVKGGGAADSGMYLRPKAPGIPTGAKIP